MSMKRSDQVDLARLFSTVTTTLKENQQSLNAADDYNHNHGDNMVQNFQTITRAVRAKKDSPPAEQLAYASQALRQRSQSGSAQLYSQGLSQAAERFQGKPAITQDDAMLLVQALMGGQTSQQQSQSSGADLLSSLLGGPSQSQGQASGADLLSSLMGSPTPSQDQSPGADLLDSLLGGQTSQQQSQPAGGDLLGGLLGAFMGGAPAGGPAQSAGQFSQSSAAQGGGIDLNTLLTAGMAFFKARQQGAEPLAALVQAVMAGSQMQNSVHHSQSGQLVAQTLLSTLGKMLSGKR